MIGSCIIRERKVPNSFDYVRLHHSSFQDGTVLLVDEMEEARGRQGRKWTTYQGQLLVTILLKPPLADVSLLSFLHMSISSALIKSLAWYNPLLRWPNDIMIEGKKVAGILIETIIENNVCVAFMIGVGLNVNNRFNEKDPLFKQATSLAEKKRDLVDREKLFQDMVYYFNNAYGTWQNGEFEDIFKEWISLQSIHNHPIRVHGNKGEYKEGIVEAFTPSGDLILKDSCAQLHHIFLHNNSHIELL